MASSGEARLAAYRRRVQARYTPVVTTVCTPDADAACAAAGVSFADLVRPHASDVRGLDVPMRHNPDAPPYVIDAFAMRVHSLAECRHASSDQAEAHADASHAPWSDASERSLAAILDAIPRDVTSLVALASGDGLVSVWARDTGRRVHSLSWQSDVIKDIRFSPSGRWLAASIDALTRPVG